MGGGEHTGRDSSPSDDEEEEEEEENIDRVGNITGEGEPCCCCSRMDSESGSCGISLTGSPSSPPPPSEESSALVELSLLVASSSSSLDASLS
jgi:hypothetical protein